MTNNIVSSTVSTSSTSNFFSGEAGWKGEIIFNVYEADKEEFEKHCKEKEIEILDIKTSDSDSSLFYYSLPKKKVEDLEEVRETWGIRCGCGSCAPELRYEWEW